MPSSPAVETRVDDTDVFWLAATHRPSPPEALRRIRAICEQSPELFAAPMTVVATHQGLRHDILAAAVKQFRRDLDPFSRDDVTGMLRACWNGGWQGFDAVLRTRQKRERATTSALPGWMRQDD